MINSVIKIKIKVCMITLLQKRKKSACIRAGFCCIAENPPCPCSSLQSIWIDGDNDDGDGDHDDLGDNGNDDYEDVDIMP